MLEELRVHGVGGIRNAELTFADGFNVITGESGAGKSSLVRALEFISGKRAQTSLFDDAAGQAEGERSVSGRRLQHRALVAAQAQHQIDDRGGREDLA